MDVVGEIMRVGPVTSQLGNQGIVSILYRHDDLGIIIPYPLLTTGYLKPLSHILKPTFP